MYVPVVNVKIMIREKTILNCLLVVRNLNLCYEIFCCIIRKIYIHFPLNMIPWILFLLSILKKLVCIYLI